MVFIESRWRKRARSDFFSEVILRSPDPSKSPPTTTYPRTCLILQPHLHSAGQRPTMARRRPAGPVASAAAGRHAPVRGWLPPSCAMAACMHAGPQPGPGGVPRSGSRAWRWRRSGGCAAGSSWASAANCLAHKVIPQPPPAFASNRTGRKRRGRSRRHSQPGPARSRH